MNLTYQFNSLSLICSVGLGVGIEVENEESIIFRLENDTVLTKIYHVVEA